MIDPISNKVHISRDLHLFEDKRWDWSTSSTDSDTSTCAPSREKEVEHSNKTLHKSSPSDHTYQRQVLNHQNSNVSPDELDFSAREDEATPVRFRNFKDIYSSCSFALTVAGPIIYEEAVKDDTWIKAMNEELKAIERNGTWELPSLPDNKKAIGLKRIFKSKFNSDGSLLKKKAHLIAKEFSQRDGINFKEVFSPVT